MKMYLLLSLLDSLTLENFYFRHYVVLYFILLYLFLQ